VGERRLEIRVDASEAARRWLRASLALPAPPGPLTLFYPRWIPGEHSPTGPVAQLTGLRLTAAGRTLSWRRDPLNLHAFTCEVPAAAGRVEIALDYLLPRDSPSFAAGTSTGRCCLLSWTPLVLLPGDGSPEELTAVARVRKPPGWSTASALPVAEESAEEICFRPVPLTALLDSPVLLGAHLTVLPVGDFDGKPHRIALATDSPDALAAVPGDLGERYARLVAEAGALFASRPYDSYTWLVTLSDHVSPFGLEHRESSDNRMPEETFEKEPLQRDLAALLSHEYLHTWNGFARRPAGLLERDYQRPLDGSLLWVYEGLTQYLGFVLATRSGLWAPERFHAHLAMLSARLDAQAGRRWRPLADTAVSAQSLYEAPVEGMAWRRGTDFYDEGLLIWLTVDALLRRRSGGRRSLNDFCAHFFGAGHRGDRAYAQEDVERALAEIEPQDWSAFFAARLQTTGEGAPLDGLAACGWRLVYRDEDNPALKDREERFELHDWTWSLGFQVHQDGRVRDVVPDRPAHLAGIAPGMRLAAVNGREWSPRRVDAALRAARGSSEPLSLLLIDAGQYQTFGLHWHGGPQQPHLERDSSQPDLLAAILRPLAG
jgi:predicted metalloprotease with PDZ domain